jgi:hypothetical protein
LGIVILEPHNTDHHFSAAHFHRIGHGLNAFPTLCHYASKSARSLFLQFWIFGSAMSSVAQKRLFHEYKNLSTNPPDGITAGPVSEDDMFHWEALIQGPEGTPYEGGVFAAELKFPKDYPLSPPTMKFVGGGVWHPNGEE